MAQLVLGDQSSVVPGGCWGDTGNLLGSGVGLDFLWVMLCACCTRAFWGTVTYRQISVAW